jgi:hypothetical protein
VVIDSVEILFVAASSADNKGKRVLVREAGCENCIFPEDTVTDADRELLGITQRDQERIEEFLGNGER